MASAVHAQSLKSNEILSTVTVQPVSEPNPVQGADGRVHLAYELLVDNPTNLFVRLDKVEAVDAVGKSLSSLDGERLARMMQLYGGSDGMLSPGGTGIVFMDVSFASSEKLPDRILARIAAFRQHAGPDGKPTPLPADAPVPASYSFTGGATALGKPAVVLEPPLRGTGWIAANGCCDTITSHRGATMAVNGLLRVPERFAIDWLKLDDTGRVFTGEATRLESYAYYGTPVYAAAGGTVVNLYDEADEQVPSQAAKGITTENIGGNMLVIDIGHGAFAFYAHLQRGSLKVKLGDLVKTGQAIGLLGNTGNSTAPHLHFHVMDGPSPLDANGLPFVFTHFSSQGVLAPGNEDALEQGGTARIDPKLKGQHVNELPLNDEVVDF
ncbi:M23 family metallopeptidase [Labrys okinawensis]|uniref:M23 family metallopeptidase n=1 Tax=Labrys okinawensis TaxID=346911 RepID=UPI0039BCB74D